MARTTVRDADCTSCGGAFQTDQPHRRKCYACAPPRVRGLDNLSQLPFQAVPDLPEDKDPPEFRPGRIEKMTVKRLADLGQLETPDGALLERMARDLDGNEVSGAARTSMSKQLSAALAEIEAKAPKEKDLVDTWADRARKRRERAIGE
jgi:hypothetical protein